MPSLLADHLSAACHHQFVGRGAELRLFEEALAADALPFHILYVHGPGGVGKTALLQEMRRRSCARGVPTFHLDARDLAQTR